MSKIRCSKIVLMIGADETTAVEVGLQSIDWDENVEAEDCFDSDEDKVQDFSLGKYKVTGRFVLKTENDGLDTYLAVPRVVVPYMHAVGTEVGGTTTHDYGFDAPVYLGRTGMAWGLQPEVAKRTVEFMAQGITPPA